MSGFSFLYPSFNSSHLLLPSAGLVLSLAGVTPLHLDTNKLKLVLNRPIAAATNLNFFILRRYRYSPNSIVVNQIFPYGGLPSEKEFVVSDNTLTNYFDASGDAGMSSATTASAVSTPSGSFITKYQPLLKQNNTPTGIIFPQYPIAAIEIEPDNVIRNLRDKKLIE